MKKNNKIINFTSCLILSLQTTLLMAKQQGGTVSVPVIGQGFTENFNPYTTNGLLSGVMFEPLFVFDNLTNKTHFLLAESAEYSGDFKSITLSLRDNLTWSDGTPLTAMDVAYSFKIIQMFPNFDINSIWINGELLEVTAIDRQNVIFRLSSPNSTFLWKLADYPILPSHIWQNVKNLLSFKNTNPVGSGPMTEVKALSLEKMQLCRNSHYYLKGQPYLDCITFKSYKENADLQTALAYGEIDLGHSHVENVEYNFIGLDRQNHHYWYPANNAVNLYINTRKKSLNDINVRRALSMAIDRKEMVDIGFYDYPKANYNIGGISDLFSSFVDKTLNQKYSHVTKYNLRKAKILLDKAGIIDRNNDGYRDNKDGSDLTLTIDVVSTWSDWIKVVQLLQTYFEQIDMRTRIKLLDWGDYIENLQTANYSMSISWSKAKSHPISTFREYYHSALIGKGYHVNHGITSKEIDRLIDSFYQTNDKQQQNSIIAQLQKFTAEKFPFIPLFANPTWFQYSTKNVMGWPSKQNPYIQPVWQDPGKRAIILRQLYAK